MYISNYLDDIVAWAPAKVNLFLEVLAKRSDGYHEITTLMVAVRLFDTLVFRESSDLTLHCYDKKLSSGDDNLVLKAARLLQTRSQTKKGASIRLVKRIPMAAGLAGGSTDAAATLAGLDRFWQVRKSAGEVAALSSEIGSDSPFFFRTPAAWCTGRGEIVTAVNLPIPLHFVLLCPSFEWRRRRVQKRRDSAATGHGNEIRDALAKVTLIFSEDLCTIACWLPQNRRAHRRVACDAHPLEAGGMHDVRQRQHAVRAVPIA